MDRGTSPYSLFSPQPQPERHAAGGGIVPATSHELLLIEDETTAAKHSLVLRGNNRVSSTIDTQVAVQYIEKATPALVVLDLDVAWEGAVEVCRAARAASVPSTTLVIASHPEAIPPMLKVGCDAVLLKPFAPNLLYTRIARLLRARDESVCTRPRFGGPGADHAPQATTNRVWPDVACPTCGRPGAVSFEFNSHRRAWYACLGCMAVWMARRRE